MDRKQRRSLLVADLTLLAVAIFSIGQINFENRKHPGTSAVSAGTTPAGTSQAGVPGASPAPGSLGASATPGSPGAGVRASSPGGASGAKTGGTTTKNYPALADMGLVTQGVTATTVTIGADYNKTGCGGLDQQVEAQYGQAAVGDPEKSFQTFVRYINDTGGIRGRKLILKTEDDGGLYCPERHQPAVDALLNSDHVFMDIAGLHETSDLIYPHHVPFLGGRSTIAEQNTQGYGQFQLFDSAEHDFQAWAAFGKNEIASDKNTPCLIHPDTDDFNNLEKFLVKALAGYGYKFKDIIAYKDDASTAAAQANTDAATMSADGCKQVWLIANNFLADTFFTQGAQSQNWYPTWTWTSRTAGIDTQLGGGTMVASEWANAVGLSISIPAGQSPYEGNCAKIYNQYNNGDGESGSAAVLVACPTVLLSSEAMRRAVDKTGVLTGNSLMAGVNAIQGDFYYDKHVPMFFDVSKSHQSKFTGFDMSTVAKWNSSASDYSFPYYPNYWKIMGPGRTDAIDIRPYLQKHYAP